ncbi:hypothetical protein [Lysinibacillus sp. TE18511]
MCESAAAATDVFCAKAQRQRQMFFVRKRSGSGRCFLCESAAAATWFCLCESEAKRQQHDVGHSGVFTGCEALSLSSSISADVFCTESVATGTDVWTPAKIS